MREPHGLPEVTIAAAVELHYGISVHTLTFLPLGNDLATSVYRVRAADGTDYFLKIRTRGGLRVASLTMPRYLSDLGIPHVFGPLPTRNRALWVDLGEFALTLYPYVEGRSGAEAGLSEVHWRAFGRVMRQIHALDLPPDLRQTLARESFTPKGRELIPRLEDAVSASTPGDDVGAEFAAFWRARTAEIRTVVDRADALGARLRRAQAPLVLCHADMHPWNTMVDDAGRFWLVDWDEVILALKERDLMFAVGGLGGDGVGPNQTACFLEGYGEVAIDPVALAYYRCTRAVEDIADFGQEILLAPHLSDASRREALQWFRGLFSTEGIVKRALGTITDG